MIGALAQVMENQCWQTTLEIHVLTYTSNSKVLQGLFGRIVAKPIVNIRAQFPVLFTEPEANQSETPRVPGQDKRRRLGAIACKLQPATLPGWIDITAV